MPSIYVDKNNEIVPAGDPRAARRVTRPDGSFEAPLLDAMKPGLAKAVREAVAAQKAGAKAETPAEEVVEEKAAEEPEDKAAEKVENKAVEKPAENKSAKG